MVENIKKVSNPLTIIAIFAALAEVNGTVAIGLVKPDLQPIFIWFIIGFPTLLILLFFLTLNFNPRVIYAPSDFRDEENFIKTWSESFQNRKVAFEVTAKKNDIEEAKEKVHEIIKRAEEFNQLPVAEKELINKANLFYNIYINKLKPLFDKGLLYSVKFGIHSPKYFLAEFTIPKDKLISPNTVSEYSIIIKISVELNGQISLEAIGKNIKEVNEVSFADTLVEYTEGRILAAVDKKNHQSS